MKPHAAAPDVIADSGLGIERWPLQAETAPLTEVAAFDIDGTLTRRDVEETLILHLLMEVKTFRLAIKLLFLLARRASTDFKTFKESVWAAFAAVSNARLKTAIDAFNTVLLPTLIKPAAMEEIHFCRASGWKVVLVTGAISPLAEAVGALVEADYVIATHFKIDADEDGIRLRRADVNTGSSKVKRLTEWADSTLGRGAWRLRRAYSDHHSDLPLLSGVPEAVAVCPTRRLRKIARRRHWRIVYW